MCFLSIKSRSMKMIEDDDDEEDLITRFSSSWSPIRAGEPIGPVWKQKEVVGWVGGVGKHERTTSGWQHRSASYKGDGMRMD